MKIINFLKEIIWNLTHSIRYVSRESSSSELVLRRRSPFVGSSEHEPVLLHQLVRFCRATTENEILKIKIYDLICVVLQLYHFYRRLEEERLRVRNSDSDLEKVSIWECGITKNFKFNRAIPIPNDSKSNFPKCSIERDDLNTFFFSLLIRTKLSNGPPSKFVLYRFDFLFLEFLENGSDDFPGIFQFIGADEVDLRTHEHFQQKTLVGIRQTDVLKE